MRDPITAEHVAQLEAGLARTKRLVEQLLRLARQEAGSNSDTAATISLADILRTVIAELLPLADQRSIDVGLAAEITTAVRANADELRSLLHNLLDNAVRYTPRGGVVDVTLREHAGIATIAIIDNGPGIHPDLLPRVFDRFFRIEGSKSEGSGLGLSIAKNAAERNGIELELSNRDDGSGLVACVRFPISSVVHLTRTVMRGDLGFATGSSQGSLGSSSSARCFPAQGSLRATQAGTRVLRGM